MIIINSSDVSPAGVDPEVYVHNNNMTNVRWTRLTRDCRIQNTHPHAYTHPHTHIYIGNSRRHSSRKRSPRARRIRLRRRTWTKYRFYYYYFFFLLQRIKQTGREIRPYRGPQYIDEHWLHDFSQTSNGAAGLYTPRAPHRAV